MKNTEHPVRENEATREQDELVRPQRTVSEANDDDGERLEDLDEDEDEDDRAGEL